MKAQSTAQRLTDNFLSLTALQGINYLVPLITFPYLVRVLGVDQFGLFSFIMAVIGYGIIITEYGFDLSATKHISTNTNNESKINEIFSSVIVIKAVVAAIFLLILTLLVLSIDKFSQNGSLYFCAFGLVIGQVLFPIWFYQGIEKMRYITILNAVAKFIFAAAIFMFVKEPSDLYLVFIFNSLGAIIAGWMAFDIARKRFNINFSLQTYDTYIYYVKDGWYIFTSRVAVQLYQSVNIIILGFFVNNTIVGYYSIAEKIVRAGSDVFVSLPKALYPYFAQLYTKSKKLFYYRNMQLSVVLVTLMGMVAALVYYFAPLLLELITGTKPNELLVTLLHILAPLLTIMIFGTQFTNILVILNKTKLLNKIVFIAGIVNLSLVFLIIHLFSVEGLAWLNLFIGLFMIILPKAYYVFIKFRNEDLKINTNTIRTKVCNNRVNKSS